MRNFLAFIITLVIVLNAFSQDLRPRAYGISIGILKPGENNAITDVTGVMVGHVSIVKDENVRTGVTAILPHAGNLYQEKVPAAMFIGNGYGKLMGYSQVKELGNIETPIVLTNTLSVPLAANGVISYMLGLPGNEKVGSVNAIVGETNDGFLNDIRGRHVKESHVVEAINNAKSGPVIEGNVGAGTGTICFGYKGGIGTSSRNLPEELGGYTVGVLIQTNFGGVLEINGVPVAKELGNYPFKDILEKADGSCMIVVATDAPVNERNLERMAKRAMMGLSKTGGVASNGSGDYVIAFSNAEENLIMNNSDSKFLEASYLRNDEMTPLFLATIEATEEAIINSLFAAETMTGKDGHEIKELPVKGVLEIMKKYGKVE